MAEPGRRTAVSTMPPIVSCLAMSAVVIGARTTVLDGMSVLLELIVCGVLGAATYAAVMFGPFRSSTRRTVATVKVIFRR